LSLCLPILVLTWSIEKLAIMPYDSRVKQQAITFRTESRFESNGNYHELSEL